MIKDILNPLNTSGKPKTIKIGMTYPHGVARQYTADMRKIVKALAERINKELMPVVREQFKQRNDSERMDGIGDMLAVIRLIKDTFMPGDSLANSYAMSTYQHNENSINKEVERQLGVSVNLPDGDVSKVNDWVEQNASLIADLQEEYIRRVQGAVTNGFLQGKSTKQVSQEIQKATGITWRRANTIARNEIGNLNAQINKERNEELGITRAIWRTARDERVRGNPSGLYPNARPSHYAREGKEFNISEGLGGISPGEEINCRCYSESIIELD